MSAFKSIKTKMKNLDHLINVLGRVKKEWADKSVMQIDPKGQIHLTGYQGDDRALKPTTDKNYAPPCVIRIPRQYVGSASNDIGVAVGADGTLDIYISDYDKGKYGQKFIDEISQMYGIIEGVSDAQNQGATPVSDITPLNNVPGLTGKVVGVRMAMPRARAMQLTSG